MKRGGVEEAVDLSEVALPVGWKASSGIACTAQVVIVVSRMQYSIV